jgi:hypothetical protein
VAPVTRTREPGESDVSGRLDMVMMVMAVLLVMVVMVMFMTMVEF